MNDKQRLIVGIIVPIIVILLGFVIIGFKYSAQYRDSALILNPIRYLSLNGIKWIVVFLIIGIFEFFWWKGRN